MYNSPINRIFDDIQYQIVQHGENQIMEAVQKCDIIVNKDELIKALRYDRDQYDNGYKDAIKDLPIIKASQNISKDEYPDENTLLKFKDIFKKELCRQLAEYLFENDLVKFEEFDIEETNQYVIEALIKIYDMKGQNVIIKIEEEEKEDVNTTT